MKKNLSLSLLSLLLILNISCGSDDSVEENTTPLSIEEGKAQLEDNMIEALNKVDDFRNSDALDEIVELAEYLSNSSTSKVTTSFKKTTLSTINNLSSLKTANITAFNAKQTTALVSETPLTDDYNEEKGIYEWNADTEEFDKTGDSDIIIYKVNYYGKNAIFSFTNFNTTIENDEEVPTLVKANLKVDNTTVFSQEFTASFEDNGLIPSMVNNTTTIGGFKLITAYTNSNSALIKQSFDFKIDDDVITGYELIANGDFNNENDQIEDSSIEDVLNDFDLKFKVLNANLSLTANDKNFNSDDDLTIDEQIELLNNNIKGELSIKNRPLAKTEFYKDQDTYMDYEYDPNTQNWEEIEVSEEIINARFLFEDGSSSDFEAYFEGSFTELENKFEAVFEAYEKLFENIDA
ncbi:hypothetical protein [Pseudotamlana agarivorans]|uniref:hypothetical protein n=1 Tax=Pseudotamlana agarivorans TaxID=481183 RepID=UPI000836B7E7|nr:hypothetical protein [Tamlana agarivorans]